MPIRGGKITGDMFGVHSQGAVEFAAGDEVWQRMRLPYARPRSALLDALARLLPAARAGDDPAGVFELVTLPAAVDEPGLLAAAARRRVGLEGLSWHRSAAGILVGYPGQSEPALARGAVAGGRN